MPRRGICEPRSVRPFDPPPAQDADQRRRHRRGPLETASGPAIISNIGIISTVMYRSLVDKCSLGEGVLSYCGRDVA
jgi:hypothetical protein